MIKASQETDKYESKLSRKIKDFKIDCRYNDRKINLDTSSLNDI